MAYGFGGGIRGTALGGLILATLTALASCDDSSDAEDGAGMGGQGAVAGRAGGGDATSGRTGAGGSSGSSVSGGAAGRGGGGSSGNAGEGKSGGSGGKPATPSALRPECPEAPPDNGTSCSDEEVQCQYGAEPRPECRPVATCKAGLWSVPSIPASRCPEPTDVACPGTMDELEGERCTLGGVANSGPFCQYEDVTCACDESTCDATDCAWFCPPPLEEMDCPRGQPNVGTSCDDPSITCKYTTCQDHRCVDGYWSAVDNGSCSPTPVGS